MAEPLPSGQAYLDKYQKDVVTGTWEATGIFTGIAYGSGLLLRPFAPQAAGKIASLGSATHLPPATKFKGAAHPRAGLVTIFNAVPAPGWITPPEILGINPDFLVKPGEFGGDVGKLTKLAGLEPTEERVQQDASVRADKLSRYYHTAVPRLETATLRQWYTQINYGTFQTDHPYARVSEVSAIVYGELLRRGVFDITPASEFERGLRQQAMPILPPYLPPEWKGNATPPPAPLPPPAPGGAPVTAGGIFGPVATMVRTAPDTYQPVYGAGIRNVSRATGIRKQLATEREDP